MLEKGVASNVALCFTFSVTDETKELSGIRSVSRLSYNSLETRR